VKDVSDFARLVRVIECADLKNSNSIKYSSLICFSGMLSSPILIRKDK